MSSVDNPVTLHDRAGRFGGACIEVGRSDVGEADPPLIVPPPKERDLASAKRARPVEEDLERDSESLRLVGASSAVNDASR
jgi:hypothetical protein